MLSQILNNEPWVAEAICAQTDPELFFPEIGGSPRQAKAICQRCPVRKPCLEHALKLDYEAHGVWGGTTANERQRIKNGLPPEKPKQHRRGAHRRANGHGYACKCDHCEQFRGAA